MADSALEAETVRFIHDHIHSVEQLEVLLLLREGRARAWTADEVSSELRTSPSSASARLQDLLKRGFLHAEASGAFRYATRPPALAGAVDHLAAAYAQRRVAVIEAIFERPSESLRSFAEAFRIKKEED